MKKRPNVDADTFISGAAASKAEPKGYRPPPGRKRLTIDLPSHYHDELRELAFKRRVHMRQLVIEALDAYLLKHR